MVAHSIRSYLTADRDQPLVQQSFCNVDLIVHDQGACLKAPSSPTTMVQLTIYSNYTTVYDGGNVVANEVDLFLIYCLVICVAACHACNADFCRVVVGMTVTPASYMDMAKQTNGCANM